MASLEDLFTLGSITETVDIKGVTFRVALLNSKVMQDALNATSAVDPTAYAVEYKKQILARSITNINGMTYVKNVDAPDPADVSSVLEVLNRLHYTIINKVFDVYSKMDDEIAQEMKDAPDAIKK